MKSRNLLMIVFVAMAATSYGQDAILRNPYSNPMWLNPAYAGGSEGKTVYTSYYLPWTYYSNIQLGTFFASADIPVDKLNGGFGLMYQHDVMSSIATDNKFYLAYSQSFNLKDNLTLQVGVKGGAVYRKLDLSRVTFANDDRGFIYSHYMPYEPLDAQTVMPGFGGGVALTSKRFDIGFAMDHLNRPPLSPAPENKMRVATQFHTSYTIGSGSLTFTPNIIYRHHGGFHYLLAGGYLNYKALLLGLNTIPHQEGGVVMAGLKLKQFRLGYSMAVYRYSLSWLSHELMLSAGLPEKNERKKLRKKHTAMGW